MRNVSPARSPADAHQRSAFGIRHDLHAVQRRQIEQDAVVERAPCTVATTPYDNGMPPCGGEAHRVADVVDAGDLHDDVGATGTRMRRASGIPPLVFGGEHCSGYGVAKGCGVHASTLPATTDSEKGTVVQKGAPAEAVDEETTGWNTGTRRSGCTT